MVEVLLHLELEDDLPVGYTFLRVRVPDELPLEEINVPENDAWKSNHNLSRRLGDEWLARRTAALARVPSALLPNTWNYLLNPLHRDAEFIQIVDSTRAEFDSRLLKHLRG
jgi:RES domain-containing protein